MLDTASKYDYVKDILVTRMSKYRRNSFQLQRLYEIIREQTCLTAYVDFSYKEFRDMFQKECVDGNIPYRQFKVVNEGFLDKKQHFPCATVEVKVLAKNNKSNYVGK